MALQEVSSTERMRSWNLKGFQVKVICEDGEMDEKARDKVFSDIKKALEDIESAPAATPAPVPKKKTGAKQ